MRVIVSLTSFPAAIGYCARAVESLLKGSVLPERVVLWLSLEQFPEAKVPAEIAPLMADPRFEVRFLQGDIRSYKKLIPALEAFPDAIVVTADDDVRYHRHMLRDLLRMHAKFPDAVIAHRAKRVELGAPYKKWRKYRWYHFLFKRYRLDPHTIQTGVAGVLYPPHALDPAMLDEALFMRLAPTSDDIWFWAAAVRGGRAIVPVPMGRNKPRGLGKPKALSLKTTNFKSGTDRNRAALEAILGAYPEIRERL